MNLIKSFFLSLVLIAFSQVSLAQESVVKIGYFNLVKVMRSVPQAQQAEKRLETEFAPRKSRIEGLDVELEKMKKDFEKESLVMSQAEQDAKRRDLRNRQREFKLLLQEYEEDLSLRQNQETSSLQKLVRSAVLEVAKEENFDLIIDQGAVIFASDKVDITSMVMQRLAKL
jgi:outer membrane protein